jgi:para-nitrobenzyl esterase
VFGKVFMQFRALPAALLLLPLLVLHPVQLTDAQRSLNLRRGFDGIRATGQLPSPEVEVTGGKVRGVALSNGVFQFTGIPFAKPPTRENDLRWRAPVAPDSWNGTIELTDWAPICAQFMKGMMQGEEDCLYINVWATNIPNSSVFDEDNAEDSFAEARANATMARARALRPVMVWIHGGGFEEGSVQTYNGSNLMEQLGGSIVYVSTPYRLGPFGFLGSEALRKRTVGEFGGTTGNYGMLDQRMALEWVKANIAQFGGDPNKVTECSLKHAGCSLNYAECSLITPNVP